MSDKRASHIPPPRFKSTARPWRDIPGRCGYYVGQAPQKHPCCKPATHRCRGTTAEGEMRRYGWLCKDHAAALNYSTKMLPQDQPLLNEGRICDVWKCTRKASKWTPDGYAICNSCSGN